MYQNNDKYNKKRTLENKYESIFLQSADTMKHSNQ